jgi:hypothetical protein
VAEIKKTVFLFLSDDSVTADVIINESSANIDLLNEVYVDGCPDETEKRSDDGDNDLDGEVKGRLTVTGRATSRALKMLESIVDPEHVE